MFKHLKIEWLKLRSYRPIWILFGLYVLSIFGANYVVFFLQKSLYEKAAEKGEMLKMIAGDVPYAFPLVWQMSSYVSSFLLFLPGIILIIAISNEFGFRTHRQNVIDGWTRANWINAKTGLAVVLALLSTAVVFLSALTFGLIEGSHGLDFSKTYYLGFFFLQALSYCMVALVCALFLRSAGLSIGAYLLYAVILENIAAGIINRCTDYYGRYLPLEVNDNLVPLPLFTAVQKEMIKAPNMSLLLAVAFSYLALYYLVARWRFEKSDL